MAKALSQGQRAQLEALGKEVDPGIFWRDLLSFAGQLESLDHQDAAAALYATIISSEPSPGGKSTLPQVAQSRLDAIQGKGAFGPRLEFLLKRFTKDASDPKMILPMLAGSAVYSMVRGATLSRLAATAEGGLFTRGIGARFAASSIGFVAEVPVFALSARALRHVSGEIKPGQDTGVGHDLAGAAITLGLLKSFFFLGQKGFQGLHGIQASGAATRFQSGILASQFIFTQGSIFSGLMAAHKLEEKVGLRPHLDGATTFTDTLASMVSLGIGAHLGHKALGKGYARWNQELNLHTKVAESSLPPPRRTNSWIRNPLLAPMWMATGAASWLAAGSGLLTLLAPLRAGAGSGFLEGTSDPTLHQAGFEWFHLLEAGALAGAAWYAYDGILRIRASLLARSSVSDPKALEQLAGMARPGSRTYVLKLLAGLAEQNAEAVFALHAVGLRFGNRRVGIKLLEGLNTEGLFSQVLADPQVLDALILLAGLGNRSAKSGLSRIDLSSGEERVQTNPDLALGLASLATQYGNSSALGILKGMNTPELIRRGAGDWKALPPLILQGITGNRSAMEFLQDFDPVPVLEATASEDLATAIERALLPIGLLGNEAARGAFRGLDPDLLRDSVPQNFQLVQDLVFIAEWGNSRAESVLAEVGESYPLAVSNLALLARYGHKIALNLLMHLNPSQIIQNAPVDPWAFYAMVELAHAGNRRAQGGLLQHLRAYPRSQQMVEEITASNFQHPAVGGIFQALQEICQFSFSEFSKLSGTRQMAFIRRFWTRWQELPKPRRLEYFQRDQRIDMNSLVPLSWILEEGRKEGWKASPEMREILPSSPKPPSRPKKGKRR